MRSAGISGAFPEIPDISARPISQALDLYRVLDDRVQSTGHDPISNRHPPGPASISTSSSIFSE